MLLNVIVDVKYKVMIKLSSAIIKALLILFVGPFAWLVGTGIEIGGEVTDFFLDLRAKISDFVHWILKNIWLFFKNLLSKVGAEV